jgi:predicted dehydrogenase
MNATRHSVNIGMIGYNFMGKAHSHAYRDAPFFFELPVHPVLKAICGRNPAGVKAAAEKFGFESVETDWRELIRRDDIDVIDVCTPNHSHKEIVLAAAAAGKHVICEKPLAMNEQEAKEMLDAVNRSGVVHMVCHNYRFAPAVRLVKNWIDSGKLGNIYHIRAAYLQDWILDPQFPLVWRLQKELTGSGAHGDLACHCIDLARFLVGELDQVSGMMETFVKERPLEDGSLGKVDVDDASIFMARFQSGALGTFEATRFAAGNRNKNKFEINGSKGSVRWDLENMNLLDVYFTDDEADQQGFKTINVTEAVHPYTANYWFASHIIGYEHTFVNMISEFMQAIATGTAISPTFEDGYRNQAVLDAVEKSAREMAWVKL